MSWDEPFGELTQTRMEQVMSTWSTGLTWDEMTALHEVERKMELANAKSRLSFYQQRIKELEAADPLNRVSTSGGLTQTRMEQ